MMDRDNSHRKLVLGLAAALVLAAYVILALSMKGLLWDETVYLSNARSHVTASNFTEDFRYPLLEYMIAAFWQLTGERILAAHLLMAAMAFITVALLYMICIEYIDWRLSLLATLLYAFSPVMLFWSFRAYTDIPSMMFVLLSAYLLIRALHAVKGRPKENRIWNRQNILLAASAVCASLAFLTRFVHGLYIAAVFVYLFIIAIKQGRPSGIISRFRHLIIFALFAFLAITPWLAYNQITYHDSLWDFKEQFRVVDAWTGAQPVMMQISNFFLTTNTLIPIIFLLGIAIMAIRRPKHWELISIYTVAALIYYLLIVKLKDPRYYISILPFIYLIAFYGMAWLTSQKRLTSKIISSLFIGALVVLAAAFALVELNEIAYHDNCIANGSISQAINYMSPRISTNETVLSNNWPWIGYGLNTRVASLWDNDIGMLISTYSPDYILYIDEGGNPYDKNILDNSPRLSLEKVFTGACKEHGYLYKVN